MIENQPFIRGIEPIAPLLLEDGGDRATLHGLRAAAARQGCELLLVYVQASSRVNNFNDAAALYWTVVGLWLVPGNVLEHRTVAQGLLMDCRTGVILGTASGDCHRKRACPAAFLDIARDQLAAETPAKAVADLQAACARLIKKTTEAAADRAGAGSGGEAGREAPGGRARRTGRAGPARE